jgi:hypothetical protein
VKTSRFGRLQFGLRTLIFSFTALALIGAWLGREAQTVRLRASMAAVVAQDGGFLFYGIAVPENGEPSDAVPWIRRMMGDKWVARVAVPVQTAVAERAKIAAAFPGVPILAFRPPLKFHKGSGIGPFFPFSDAIGATPGTGNDKSRASSGREPASR